MNAQEKKDFIGWSIASELPSLNGSSKALGVAGPVTGVIKDILLVAGGCNFPIEKPWNGGKKIYYNNAYIYLKKTNNLELSKFNDLKLPNTVAYAAVCNTANGLLYAGGENQNGLLDDVYLLQLEDSNSKIDYIKLPSLPIATTNAFATAIDNMVYFAGGETHNGVSDNFYKLDLDNLNVGWQELISLPKPISHALLIAIDKESVYLVGGRNKNNDNVSNIYSSVYKFDIIKNQWFEKSSLPYPLSAGSGTAINRKEFLIFGGDTGDTFLKAEKLNLAITKEMNQNLKNELTTQKINLLNSHPGFCKEVLLYNADIDKWTSVGVIPFDTPVTTIAIKCDNLIYIPSGEIKAGVRTPKILKATLNPL